MDGPQRSQHTCVLTNQATGALMHGTSRSVSPCMQVPTEPGFQLSSGLNWLQPVPHLETLIAVTRCSQEKLLGRCLCLHVTVAVGATVLQQVRISLQLKPRPAHSVARHGTARCRAAQYGTARHRAAFCQRGHQRQQPDERVIIRTGLLAAQSVTSTNAGSTGLPCDPGLWNEAAAVSIRSMLCCGLMDRQSHWVWASPGSLTQNTAECVWHWCWCGAVMCDCGGVVRGGVLSLYVWYIGDSRGTVGTGRRCACLQHGWQLTGHVRPHNVSSGHATVCPGVHLQ